MQVEPYLDFNGRCDEAIEFYKSALGAKVDMLMRFKECPEPHAPGMHADVGDKVMHAALRIGNSTVMASDGRAQGAPRFQGVSLSLRVSNDAEARQRFA